jgi:hypothetical protein
LTLATGEFGGLVRGAVSQPDQLQCNREILYAFGGRQFGQQQRRLQDGVIPDLELTAKRR